MESDAPITFEQPCPIRDVLDRIGDQWSLLVLEALEAEPKRFNALMRELGDVSKQMLSRTLRKLEQDGYVHRTVFAEVPPRVEYRLSPQGLSFLHPMKSLVAWAEQHHANIVAARSQFLENSSDALLVAKPAALSKIAQHL